MCPAMSCGNAFHQLPCATRTFAAARPIPTMFARATSRASTDASVSHTCAASAPSSNAIDKPITPLPVPRSTIRRASLLLVFRAISRATCTTCSVSGRGISTRSSTITSRCLKAHRFMTYCNGTPLNRFRTMSCKLLAHATVTN